MKGKTPKGETIKDATAVVLAGGESSRFGRDKSTTSIMEQTLTERVLKTVSPLFETTLIGVRKTPHPLETLVNHPFITDRVNIKGPLAGIYTALETIKTTWLFAIACDMPLVRKEVILYLAEKRNSNHCVIPVARGRPQTLCAFYNKNALLEPMKRYIKDGGRNLKNFLNSYRINICYIREKELSEIDPELTTFIDIDTVGDMVVVEKILREGM